ncbi:MAG: hypothetical protein H6741_13445 [Alphaproteobacteria bacterium]|nr:hypothetical protein [Alphaproteobacteria bacterium]
MTSSFTLLNQTDHTVYFHVYKLGAGGLPWIDGKPRVTTVEVAAGQQQTYTPSNWVDHFALIASIMGDVILMAATIAVTVATAGAAAPADAAEAAALGEAIAEGAAEAGTEITADAIAAAIQSGTQAPVFAGLNSTQLATLMAGLGIKAAGTLTKSLLGKYFSGYAWYLTQDDGTLLYPNQSLVDLGGDTNTTAFVYGPTTTSAWSPLSANDMPGQAKLSRLPGF